MLFSRPRYNQFFKCFINIRDKRVFVCWQNRTLVYSCSTVLWYIINRFLSLFILSYLSKTDASTFQTPTVLLSISHYIFHRFSFMGFEVVFWAKDLDNFISAAEFTVCYYEITSLVLPDASRLEGMLVCPPRTCLVNLCPLFLTRLSPSVVPTSLWEAYG